MVFTIEPMINAGGWKDETWKDNWTCVTADGKRSAQYEHTLLVTETGVEILTARTATSVPLWWEIESVPKPLTEKKSSDRSKEKEAKSSEKTVDSPNKKDSSATPTSNATSTTTTNASESSAEPKKKDKKKKKKKKK